MVKNIFVIGNGESRKSFDLSLLDKHTTYGCNAIFRDYKVSVLVCKDLDITEELYLSDYLNTNVAYTFPDVRTFILNKYNDETSVKNKNLLPIPNTNTHIHYYAGLQALTLAVKEKPDNKTWIAIIITFIACVYIFYDSLSLGNFYGDLFGLITSFGLACNANIARYAKSTDLVPAAVIGKSCVAIFAFFFVKDFALVGNDLFYIPLMCVMCVAIPFVLVTIAPRFITAAEVNLFFLLETILGPLWVWMVIKEQPSPETIYGGIVIIITIAIHSLLAIKKTQTKTT